MLVSPRSEERSNYVVNPSEEGGQQQRRAVEAYEDSVASISGGYSFGKKYPR
jgi:hypothetical protein